jgi:hypothetical protein
MVLGLLLAVGGCAVTLVQPYDEKLITDSESLFKKASAMVDDGFQASPRTDEARAQIRLDSTRPGAGPLSAHPAHFAQFERRYNEILTDSDALILRSLSKSQEIGTVGIRLQKKIEALIEEAVPTNCPEMDAEFSQMTSSLTVRNFVDLKCLLAGWKAQHANQRVTQDTSILKQVNWELRRSTLFSAVLAIQSAETSKKK